MIGQICEHCKQLVNTNLLNDETKRCLHNQNISGCLVCSYYKNGLKK